jgi:arylsulfatase A-like enzyme
MRRAAFTLLLWTGLTPLVLGAEARAEHVVLVSIDGLRPELYLEPARHGMRLPTLQALMARGAYAERVIGSYPSVTYPSHTTMVTGVGPARHGIVSNTVFDPRGRFRHWFWQASGVKARTLWEAVKDRGGTSAALSWPVTVGAPIDFNLPEYGKPGSGQTEREILAEVTRPEFLYELERELGPLTSERLDGEPRESLTFEAAKLVLRKYRPQLVLLHVYHTDSMQHDHGREHPAVVAAFEGADRKLGELLATLEAVGLSEKTLVAITGDHGFADNHTTIHLNVAFREAGFLKVGSDGSVSDWAALAWPSGGSAAVIVRDPQADAERVERWVDHLLAGPLGGAMRKISRAELARLQAMPDALFALEATDGYHFGSALEGPLLTPSEERGYHGYLPEWERMATGFVMAGPGVRAGIRIPLMRQIDIAPTLAALAGWELKGAQGLVLEGVFEK